MKIQIDLKSAVAGLALGIAIMFCVGAGTPSSPLGKYYAVIGAGNAAMILDTQTGEAWAIPPGVSFDNKSPQFWAPKSP